MENINIVLSGLGGQGILFMTKILAQTALRKGSNILGAETHGMAQRGGSVISHLRIGEAKSSLINTGAAQCLLALEENEAYRNLAFVAPGGTLYVNGEEDAVPREAVRPYLEKKQMTTRVIPAGRVAMEMGAPRSSNLALLGFMSAFADNPFKASDIRETIGRVSPEPFKAINFKVFDAGASLG
jgi:indolepyruvate ferredoxin oxidoreductase, beta subunit